jgi:CDP-glucose 4,6-dehydratase
MNPLFWRHKKVLITGHTGFKGSWLSLWLQDLQADLCGIALSPITTPNLFELAHVTKNMQSHIMDVRNFGEIKKIIHQFQPEIIIHMAAQPLVRYSYDYPAETYEVNVMGTVNILEAARTCASVKTVINVTTDKCYENKEWVWGYRENEVVGGHDPYSNSKACSELITSAYRDSFYKKLGKGLASARAGNVIGGGDWSQDRLVADIMKAITDNKPVIIRNAHAIRPWQHVLEPLSGYLLLAEKLYDNAIHYSGAWNFGPYMHETTNVENIVEKIFNGWNRQHQGWKIVHDKNQPHEANFLKLDITKAMTELSWKPQLSLDMMIAWVVEWYQAEVDKRNMREYTLMQIKDYQLKVEEKNEESF